MRITGGDCQWYDTSAAVKMTWDASATSLGVGALPSSISASTNVIHVHGTNAELKAETDSTGGWAFSHYKSPDGSWTVGMGDADQFRITNSTALTTDSRLVIDTSGNVGIGVVPETDWDSAHTALQIGLNGSLMSHTTSAGWTQLMKNARYVGSSVYKYIIEDQATRYVQKDDGTHAFEVAVSGTADAAITWVEALSIANDGDVKIE